MGEKMGPMANNLAGARRGLRVGFWIFGGATELVRGNVD